MSARAENIMRRWRVVARFARSFAVVAALGISAPTVFAPSGAEAACAGRVSIDQVRAKASRAFKNWRILSVRLAGRAPNGCPIYEVRLRSANGSTRVARWDGSGARLF